MLRLARQTDMSDILRITNDAVAFLAQNGVDQWQDGYPNEAVFLGDIAKKQLYVYELDNQIIGMSVIQTLPELTYDTIDGAWLTQDKNYAVIHRCGVIASQRGQSYGKQLFLAVENYVKETLLLNAIRIDTHEDNKVMQNLLRTLEYTYCGIIDLNKPMANPKRLAYEKIIV